MARNNVGEKVEVIPSADIRPELFCMRIRGVMCDVVLISSSKRRFPAHTLVLSAASPYFKAMFKEDSWIESTQKEIEMKDISDNILDDILAFAYTGLIALTHSNVMALLEKAHYLCMDALFHACCKYLGQRIGHGNCIEACQIAELYNNKELRRKALNFITRNFHTLTKNKRIMSLSLDSMKELVKSSDLFVETEDEVFTAVAMWADHSCDVERVSRNRNVGNLLRSVRFPLMTHSFLCDVVENHPLMTTPECRKFVAEAFRYKLLPNKRHLISEERTKPRKYLIGIPVINYNCQGLLRKRRAPWNYFDEDYF